MEFLLFVLILVIGFSLVYIIPPSKKAKAKVIKKYYRFYNSQLWVEFQETETGMTRRFRVSLWEYDKFMEGQVGTIFHRFGILRTFKIEEDAK